MLETWSLNLLVHRPRLLRARISNPPLRRANCPPRLRGCLSSRPQANSAPRTSTAAGFSPFCFAMLLVLFSPTYTPCQSARAQDSKLAQAIPQIESAIQKSGADVAVAFRTLDGKIEWLYREHELFHQVKEGKLKLEDPLTVHNEFHSIVDGSIYKLDTSDDSDAALYKLEGQTQTLAQLCELMITVSSNFATNLLIEKLGVENIRATVHALNADEMKVLRGVEDNKAFEKGLSNSTTASGLRLLLEALSSGKAVDADSSRQMVEILKRQTFNDGIPAGVPAGVAVAHKTGEITKIYHDAAIVYAPRPFVLVILVRGLADRNAAILMAEITRRLYAVAN